MQRFYRRIESPVLVDVSVTAQGDADIVEVFPSLIPDLFVGQPLVVFGKYKGHGKTTLTVKGRRADGEYKKELNLEFPKSQAEHQVLATLWARTRIDYLMGKVRTTQDEDVKAEVIRLSKQYRVLSQYTAFVAVEEVVRNRGGKTERVVVPVEIPEGVSHEGVFGDKQKLAPTQPYGGAPAGPYPPSPTRRQEKVRGNYPATTATEAVGDLPDVDATKATKGDREEAEKRQLAVEVRLVACTVLSGETRDRDVEGWIGGAKQALETKLKALAMAHPGGAIGTHQVKVKLAVDPNGRAKVVSVEPGGTSDDFLKKVVETLKAWLAEPKTEFKTGEVKLTFTVQISATP